MGETFYLIQSHPRNPMKIGLQYGKALTDFTVIWGSQLLSETQLVIKFKRKKLLRNYKKNVLVQVFSSERMKMLSSLSSIDQK